MQQCEIHGFASYPVYYHLIYWEFGSVAYLGYGRHGPCHGRNFERAAKIAWQK